MRILIDGDACPVKKLVMEIAEKLSVKVILVHSTSHFGVLKDYERAEKIMVDNESQAADMAIINNVTSADIVATNDFGLASLVLAKKAAAISFSGNIYTEENIDKLLFERHMSAEIRRSGKRVKGPAKRTTADDAKFAEALRILILKKMKDI